MEKMTATAIKRIRICKGLSVIDLAKKAGVTRTSIYNYEKGDDFPSTRVMGKLAKALDCQIKDLID